MFDEHVHACIILVNSGTVADNLVVSLTGTLENTISSEYRKLERDIDSHVSESSIFYVLFWTDHA